MEEAICLSPSPLNLTTAVRSYLSVAIVLAREGVEVHLHTAQTQTEHFCYVHGRTVILKSCFIVRIQHLDHRMHLATYTVNVVTGSISTIQRITGPEEYQDIAAQIITDPSPYFTVGTGHLGLQASLGVRPDVGDNVKDISSDHITYFQSSDVHVLSLSQHFLRLLELFQ
jgi:hypothetical protein